jgi:hypothetical protein
MLETTSQPDRLAWLAQIVTGRAKYLDLRPIVGESGMRQPWI